MSTNANDGHNSFGEIHANPPIFEEPCIITVHLRPILNKRQPSGSQSVRTRKPGDIVCLIGDLGAGKTTLTKGIGCALGLPESQISSPTFALIAEHRGGRLPLYHLDVYRLSSGEDLTGTGFDDYLLAADGLTVIEWADRVSDALPEDLLIVRITTPSDVSRRVIEVSADGERSEGLMDHLRDAHLPASRGPLLPQGGTG